MNTLATTAQSRPLASWLFTLYVYAFMLGWTLASALLAPFALALCWLATREPPARIMRRLIVLYGRVWMWFMSLAVPVRVSGARDQVPSPCIYTPNHASFFDVYCLGASPNSDITLVVRAWPFRIPLYRWFMLLANYINSEETDQERFFEKAREALASPTALTLFPEGHRTKTGGLGRFFSGAFKLSMETGVPVVPICFSGTFEMLPPGSKLLSPGPIHIRFLPPVHPADYVGTPDAHLRMKRDVKMMLERALEEMN